ncbi:MAG: LysR family transcriptional regulator [Myxococcota bacterium]
MFTPYSLDQLTMFLAVVDEGSFSAAGRRLGRVQSAVSYGISQLESSLGAQLFERRGRTPTLTETGQRLASESRLVLARARELTEAASRLQAGIEPELCLVADALYPLDELSRACSDFRSGFPTTSLRLEVGLLSDAVDLVLEGHADLGICNLAGGIDAQLAVSHVGTVQVLPVCATTHPLAHEPGPQSGAMLEQHTQIVHSERQAHETADQGVLGSRTWRVTDLGMKAALIRAGVGWGSLPAWMAGPLVEAGELVRLFPAPWPADGHRVSLHAVTRRDRPLGRAGQWFRHHLELAAPENRASPEVPTR